MIKISPLRKIAVTYCNFQPALQPSLVGNSPGETPTISLPIWLICFHVKSCSNLLTNWDALQHIFHASFPRYFSWICSIIFYDFPPCSSMFSSMFSQLSSWGFLSHRGTPSHHHPFRTMGIFPEINHPANYWGIVESRKYEKNHISGNPSYSH